MKYEKLTALSEAIDTFNDAKFISLLDENTAIVQNTSTGSLFSLPFSIEEGYFKFHPASGSLLEEASAPEQEQAQLSLRSISEALIKTALDKNESAYEEGLDVLKSLSISKKKSVVTAEEVDEYIVTEGSERSILDESEASFADSFADRWSQKLSSVVESFKAFSSYGNLFEGNSLVDAEELLDLSIVGQVYIDKIIATESFLANGEAVIEWLDYLKEELEEPILPSVFKDLNPLSPSWKSDLSKGLVRYKKEVNESVSVPKISMAMNKKFEELFEGGPMEVSIGLGTSTLPGSANGENKLHFLKMNGKFTSEDLCKLIEDFDYVLGSWPHLDEESIVEISKMRNNVDYMYRTNMIDDETVGGIINRFNMKFGRDGRDAFSDALRSAGNPNPGFVKVA